MSNQVTLASATRAALVAFCFLAAPGVSAEAITGKVIAAATNDSAMIAVEGKLKPRVGDKVAIFFQIPRTDDEISVGSGIVTAIEPKFVRVKVEKATGKIERGQLVRVTPANVPTQPGGAAKAATQVSTAGQRPNVAIVDVLKIFSNRPKSEQAEKQLVSELRQLANAGKWSVVFDSSAPGAEHVPFILYCRGVTDLTELTSKKLASPSTKQQSIDNSSASTASLQFAQVDMHKVFDADHKTKQQ